MFGSKYKRKRLALIDVEIENYKQRRLNEVDVLIQQKKETNWEKVDEARSKNIQQTILLRTEEAKLEAKNEALRESWNQESKCLQSLLASARIENSRLNKIIDDLIKSKTPEVKIIAK